MEITEREAARRLAERHLISRDQARRVLIAGLAGPARRYGRASLYQEDHVGALLDRPMCCTATLDAVRPFIVRIGRRRSFDVTLPWERQAEVVRCHWYVPRITIVTMAARSPLGPDRQPFVATLGGFVVFGGDVTGSTFDSGQVANLRSRNIPYRSFDLERPGAWYDDLRDTWLPLHNGAAWTLWGAATTTPSRLDSLRSDYDEQVAAAADAARTARPMLRAAAARAARPQGRR